MRRVLVPNLDSSPVPLPPAQAHHLRDVLRLSAGAEVELFDGRGNSAVGRLIEQAGQLAVAISARRAAETSAAEFAIATAIPKGPRADWMVEKLSELGCAAMIPLLSERSVVTAEGQGKRGRWGRLAEESARQCGRSRVMRIGEPMKLGELLPQLPGVACFGTTQGDARPLLEVLMEGSGSAGGGDADNASSGAGSATPLTVRTLILIGPEGGWTDAERQQMRDAGLLPVSLGGTILRVETAAIAAAALCSAVQAR